jgi:hypothetical protein
LYKKELSSCDTLQAWGQKDFSKKKFVIHQNSGLLATVQITPRSSAKINYQFST